MMSMTMASMMSVFVVMSMMPIIAWTKALITRSKALVAWSKALIAWSKSLVTRTEALIVILFFSFVFLLANLTHSII